MNKSFWIAIAICGVGLSSQAQSSSQSGTQDSATTSSQSGASTTATSSQDANISHKGKADDKNAATAGAVQGADNSAGGTAQVARDSAAASASSGAAVQAVLSKSIDTKKAKQGDEVVAKTSEDFKLTTALTVPKNSKLIGHVTEAKAYEKGKSESRLVILFDKVVLKDGKEVPMHATIQALAPPPVSAAMPGEMGAPGAPSGGDHSSDPGNGGLMGGATRSAGSSVGSATDTAGGIASNAGASLGTAGGTVSANGTGGLATNMQGAIGIRDVRLDTAAAASTQGSVLTSSSRNVHLDGGTRMVLRVSTQ